MCGIAGIHRLSDRVLPLDAMAGALLAGIEHRGQDATGFAAVSDNGKVTLDKAPTRASVFNTTRQAVPADARTVLLHTRFATQGHQSNNANNHPVQRGSVYAVHNGHIWNDFQVFSEAGMSPKADVDSESIPAAVSHHGWDRLEKAMAMLDGHFACALFDKRYPRELALVKGPGSPLCYIRTADFIVWASTAGAILYAWRKAFGTPPSLKRVVDMRAEGKILRVESALFRTTGFKIRKPSYQVKPYKPLAKTAYATSNDHWYKADPKPKRDPLALPPAQVEQAASVLSFDDEALVKCDDCGDWQPWDNMRIVGWENLYCDLCADFAVGSGLYPSSTKVRQIEDITDRQSEYGFAD